MCRSSIRILKIVLVPVGIRKDALFGKEECHIAAPTSGGIDEDDVIGGHGGFLLVGVNVGVRWSKATHDEDQVKQGNQHALGTCGAMWKGSAANW
jgi:hypothetical protein